MSFPRAIRPANVVLPVACAIISLISAQLSCAQTESRDWVGPATAAWNAPANWSPASVPTATQYAVINSTTTISVPNGTTAGGIVVGRFSPFSPPSTVILDAGGIANQVNFVASGEVPHSTVSDASALTVRNGIFKLNVIDLGLSFFDPGPGTVNVSADATWSSTETILGQLPERAGYFNVNGGKATMDYLAIGRLGYGGLTVNGPGVVDSGIAAGGGTFFTDILGIDEGGVGEAKVIGTNARWNSQELVVGNFGMGTLRIENGGSVTTGRLVLGFEAEGSGQVTVDGPSSRLSVLNATGSGLVSVGVGDKLTLTNGGAANIGSGAPLGAGMNLLSRAGLTGPGTIEGTVHNAAGAVFPGDGLGTLNITGAYQQDATARLVVELGGAAANLIDKLAIEGGATVAGAVEIQLVNGFSPVAGQQFTVLTTTGALVDGGLALAPSSAALFSLTVDELGKRVIVTRRAPLEGDYTFDGFVDGADFLKWQRTLGATTPPLDADGSKNNIVDAADLTIWSARFGQNAAPASQAIPEPSTLAITAGVLLGQLARRRRSGSGGRASLAGRFRRVGLGDVDADRT